MQGEEQPITLILSNERRSPLLLAGPKYVSVAPDGACGGKRGVLEARALAGSTRWTEVSGPGRLIVPKPGGNRTIHALTLVIMP